MNAVQTSIVSLTVSVLAATSGCGPGRDDSALPDAGIAVGLPDGAPGDPGEPGETDLPPLTIDWDAPTSPDREICITGTGPAGGVLVVSTAALGDVSQSIGSSGSFRVPVTLEEERVNTITFQAIDAQGRRSAEVVLEIEHVPGDGDPDDGDPGDGDPGDGDPGDGDPGDGDPDGGEPALVKISPLASSYHGSVAVVLGDIPSAVDGNESSFVRVKDTWEWWKHDFVAFELASSVSADHIRIVSDSDQPQPCVLGDFFLMTSNLADPVASEDLSHEEWSDWNKRDVDQPGPEKKVDLGGEAIRHVAIYFKSTDCNSVPGVRDLAEIEVYAPGPSALPDDEPTGGVCRE